MTTMVNTVTGPVSVDELGRTLIHEHFVWTYEGSMPEIGPADQIFQDCCDMANIAKSHGIKTIVDPTTIDTGRDPELLARVSEATGVNIIAATGYIYTAVGATAWWNFMMGVGEKAAEDLCFEYFMKEFNDGIGKTGIKPGFIKIAQDLNEITPRDAMIARAAARCQKETGAPIMSHTEAGTMGDELVDLLVEAGATPDKICIYHCTDNPDIRYHRRLLDSGAYMSWDRFGVQRGGFPGVEVTDEERYPLFVGLLKEKGALDRMMISTDYVTVWTGTPDGINFCKSVDTYYMGWLWDSVIPNLKERGVTDEQLDRMMIDNPRNLFA